MNWDVVARYGMNIEADIICIILLVLIKFMLKRRSGLVPVNFITFELVLDVTIIVCLSDIGSFLFQGASFAAASYILQAVNIIYYFSLTLSAFAWLAYVSVRLDSRNLEFEKQMLFYGIPILLFGFALLSNPWTGWFFTIGPVDGVDNIYQRSGLVFIHWIISFCYMIVPNVMVIRGMIKNKSRSYRRRVAPLLMFMLMPIVGVILQIVFDGYTLTQVGITLSIVLISFTVVVDQIDKDELTDITNRRGFNNFIDEHTAQEGNFYVLMCDVNAFKQINDQYGHIAGDIALRDVADILKQVCLEYSSNHVLPCRYGGDEFVVVGFNRDSAEVSEIIDKIRQRLVTLNEEKQYGYAIELSIGAADGFCENIDDVEHLMRVADEAMYDDKKRLKKVF